MRVAGPADMGSAVGLSHVTYILDHPAFSPGVVVGSVQRGRVWVKPYSGGPKWSAKVEDVKRASR
ncbi:hypothetical protein [Embleya scabrispora]|uniref:hypothetical protein n=1 Tax=Embleya scabrispora TaxID=159449 RepID=UPI00039B3CC9|nr:hypothetical protein [Embleya scabrispora]MYS85284.1 hypothetical protein [Streptomyces sp. SID5474]